MTACLTALTQLSLSSELVACIRYTNPVGVWRENALGRKLEIFGDLGLLLSGEEDGEAEGEGDNEVDCTRESLLSSDIVSPCKGIDPWGFLWFYIE